MNLNSINTPEFNKSNEPEKQFKQTENQCCKHNYGLEHNYIRLELSKVGCSNACHESETDEHKHHCGILSLISLRANEESHELSELQNDETEELNECQMQWVGEQVHFVEEA